MRTHVFAALAIAAALSGTALARTAPEVAVVEGASACGGAGYTLIATSARRSCVHSSADSYDAALQARFAGVAPVTAPPVCYGNGQSGSRVQMIYGYAEGQPNRAAATVPEIRLLMAPRMQAVVKAASAGKDLGIRFAFDAPCARLSVPVVKFPASTIAGTSADGQFGKMITVLKKLGYTRTDRKYQVIWDWWNDKGICGLGELGPTFDQPTAANLHNGSPTVGSHTDVVSALGLQDVAQVPQYSAVWRHAYTPRGPSCFELDQSHVGGQVHELFHTLGAVQLSAPHSDGAGHCTDTPSVMCGGYGVVSVPACAAVKVQVLDCGLDDYWNPAPAQGSYLATHDNIATSAFFGPQTADRLVGAPF